MAKQDWFAKEKKADERFFTRALNDFLDFLFFKFCQMEDMKAFIRKYILGRESEEAASKIVEEKHPVAIQAASEKADKSWLEKWTSIFKKFMDTLSQAADNAIKGSTQVVNRVLPPKLQPQGQQIVQNIFQPEKAVSQVQQILNLYHAPQPVKLSHFKGICPNMHQHVVEARFEKLEGALKRYRSEPTDINLVGVLHQAMRMSMLTAYADEVEKRHQHKHIHAHDIHHFRTLNDGLRDQYRAYSGAFATAGVQLVSATKVLGQGYNHSLEQGSVFNPNPLRTTPTPFNRH